MKDLLISILETIDEGIHAVDQRGITIYYNSKAALLDGLHPQDVIGKHILDVFPSLDRTSSTLLKVLKSRKPIYNQQQKYTNFKGKEVVTVNTTLPIFGQKGFLGAVEISKDITQVKQLSDKIHFLQQTLYRNSGKGENDKYKLYQFGDIIGNSNKILELIRKAQRISQSNSTVLVYGETGVGKELLVQAIHSSSHRQNGPFIAQNCGALPESLLESILFGTVKGSFTGAENKPGLFELAAGGTLFLDEINSLPLSLQGKILRVIEEKKIRRIGDTKEIFLDVRIMAAMNTDPLEEVEKGLLRKDLYYRLNVVTLYIPPLRDRIEDIEPLVLHFIDKFNKEFNNKITGVTREVLKVLQNYSWPGNVRELGNVIEAIFNFKDSGKIDIEDLPGHIVQQGNGDRNLSLREKLFQYEKELIIGAYLGNDKNITKTAEYLGIPRQTLQYKLKQFKLK
ncbi:arginine utilization regulatory protein [Anaerobranca californiensis DSM 14826]|jgi:arginine utilization regulatory protein|uniref:Arginine utilization regulatory protein n=1 Tax=Anaerobranca californiensis DSM 14826 TaxID=1120989 RepID=A0A1M6M7L4_9FIRM|nr:sigma 54-interacting transcriptional regulator [Anaerobranca californiensis]SHJ79360.1 arginine utilization regulatory protein [Anaerobranca californiensis DSM 14826]